jgi:hypothetical protein
MRYHPFVEKSSDPFDLLWMDRIKSLLMAHSWCDSCGLQSVGRSTADSTCQQPLSNHDYDFSNGGFAHGPNVTRSRVFSSVLLNPFVG